MYDTAAGLWHTEDDADGVRFFLPMDGGVFLLCPAAPERFTYRLLAMRADEAGEPRNLLGPPAEGLTCGCAPPEPVEWYAETGPLNAENGACILRGLVFRVALAAESAFRAELQCGDDPHWVLLCAVKRSAPGAFSVPVNTPRCDRFRLRLSGTGDCTVHGVTFITEKAGEVRGLVE